jgi:hypothetical protein
MYKHKKFTDLTTGKVVEVTDHFEDIVILDNKSKIKLNRLLDTGLYDEYIDPRNFFKNEGLVSAFTEKIRQIPTENIKNEQEKFDPLNPPVLKNYGDPMRPSFDEPAVLPYDPEEEKKQLMEKARAMMSGRNEKVEKQIDTFKSIIGESDEEEEIDINFPIEPELNNNNNYNNYTQPIPKKESYMQNTVDPIIQMFRNAKRNTDFQISFSINNKIPRVDFIEMMEDSYNTSIIDFLAEEFTNEILLNPEILKNRIKEQIKTRVYGLKESEPKVESPKTSVRKKTIKTND